jgi:hypothetical protein
MSTRQLRLTSVESIKKNLDKLSGKKINLVLSDKTVVFGEVFQVNPESIGVVNGRLKKINYPLTQISEIYFDTIA